MNGHVREARIGFVGCRENITPRHEWARGKRSHSEWIACATLYLPCKGTIRTGCCRGCEHPGGSTAAEAPPHDTPTTRTLTSTSLSRGEYLLVLLAGCSRVCIQRVEQEKGTWCSRCFFTRLSQSPERRVSTCFVPRGRLFAAAERARGRWPAACHGVPGSARPSSRGRAQNSPGLDCELQVDFNLSPTSIFHRCDAHHQQSSFPAAVTSTPSSLLTHLPDDRHPRETSYWR